jgi:hypothetical protein
MFYDVNLYKLWVSKTQTKKHFSNNGDAWSQLLFWVCMAAFWNWGHVMQLLNKFSSTKSFDIYQG